MQAGGPISTSILGFGLKLGRVREPANAAERAFAPDTALAGALGLSATFGMTMGDILSDDLCLYPHHNRMFGQGDIPWRHIGGQYDLSVVAPDAEPGKWSERSADRTSS